jgi:hypothetical protein
VDLALASNFLSADYADFFFGFGLGCGGRRDASATFGFDFEIEFTSERLEIRL